MAEGIITWVILIVAGLWWSLSWEETVIPDDIPGSEEIGPCP